MLAPTLSPDGEYLAALTPYNVIVKRIIDAKIDLWTKK